MRIDNWSKSGGQQAEIFMHLPFNTPVWKLKLLEDAFYELLDKKPHIYNSKASDFFLSDIVDLNRLKVGNGWGMGVGRGGAWRLGLSTLFLGVAGGLFCAEPRQLEPVAASTTAP